VSRSGSYFTLLARLHRRLRPRTYLEIGVAQGRSLALTLPGTRAVGVDPAPALAFALDAATTVVRGTSDDLFAGVIEDPLNGVPLDMVFIDGLHLSEQALRDVLHAQRRGHSKSVILLHDCNPPDRLSALRVQRGPLWAGDVWKVIALLRRVAPGLSIHSIDVPPTGLGIITGLDPSSTELLDRFDELVAEMHAFDDEVLDGDRSALAVVPDRWEAVEPLLPAPFGASASRFAWRPRLLRRPAAGNALGELRFRLSSSELGATLRRLRPAP
jgi:hypothetical protein